MVTFALFITVYRFIYLTFYLCIPDQLELQEVLHHWQRRGYLQSPTKHSLYYHSYAYLYFYLFIQYLSIYTWSTGVIGEPSSLTKARLSAVSHQTFSVLSFICLSIFLPINSSILLSIYLYLINWSYRRTFITDKGKVICSLPPNILCVIIHLTICPSSDSPISLSIHLYLIIL